MLHDIEVGQFGPTSNNQLGLDFIETEGPQGAPVIAVLGHYPDYTRIAADMGACRFEIVKHDFTSLSSSQIWELNRQFLDQMYCADAVFILATPLEQARSGSWFDREINYLKTLGAVISKTNS